MAKGAGKPQKHSAKELDNKTRLATQNVGGGVAGKADRQGGKAGHSKYVCYICKTACPSMTSMKIHWEAKHPTEPMDEAKIVDTHELHGGTTQGVAVHGTLKTVKAEKKKKEDKKDE